MIRAADLVRRDPACQDFEVATEALHLRVPNHCRLCRGFLPRHSRLALE